jgi:zinc protease
MERLTADALAIGAENPVRRALETAVFTHYTGNARYFSRSLEAILTIDADRVTSFTKEYLRADRARVVYVKPNGTLANRGGALREPRGMASAPARATPVRDAILQVARPPGFDRLHLTTLGTGLELVVGSRSSMPVVSVGLGLRGGPAFGQPPGVLELAERAGRVDATPHGDFDDYGAFDDRSIARDHVTYRVQGFSTAIEPILAILSDRMRGLRASYDAVEKLKKELGAQEHQEDLASAKGERALWRALYGDHPYGRTTLAADLRRLDRGSAEGWLEKSHQPRNAVLAVIGNVSPTKVESDARTWLSRWSPGYDAAPPRPPAPPSVAPRRPQLLLTHRAASSQAELTVGCLLPTADAAAEPSYDLLAELIERRLFEALRQQLGATYGVSAAAEELAGGAAHLVVKTTVDNGRVRDVLALIDAYWRQLSAGELDQTELDAARWSIARRFNLRFATTAQMVAAVVDRRAKGWTLTSYDLYPQRLTAVTAADVARVFTVCQGTRVLSLVGDEPTLRKAIPEGFWGR